MWSYESDKEIISDPINSEIFFHFFMCKASSFGILTELHLFPPPLLICPFRLQMLYCVGPNIRSGRCPPAVSSRFQSSIYTVSDTSEEGCWGSREYRTLGVHWSLTLVCGVPGLLGLLELQENWEQCEAARSVFVSASFYRKKFQGPFWVFQCVALKMFSYFSIFEVAGYRAPPLHNGHFFLGFLRCVFTVGNYINGKA